MDWLTVKLRSLIKKISDWSKWSFIRKAQNESLLKATYIWFVLVPVMASFLSKMPEQVTLPIGCKPDVKPDTCIYIFPIDLPFSWKMLYIASLAFIISNILYRIFAPAIIKENADFGEFERAGRSDEYIVGYMTKENKGYLLNEFKNHGYVSTKKGQEIFQIFSINVVYKSAGRTIQATSSEIRNRRVAIFEHISKARDVENLRAIRVALFCLAVSAGFSLIVALQQIRHVFQFIWQHGLL